MVASEIVKNLFKQSWFRWIENTKVLKLWHEHTSFPLTRSDTAGISRTALYGHYWPYFSRISFKHAQAGSKIWQKIPVMSSFLYSLKDKKTFNYNMLSEISIELVKQIFNIYLKFSYVTKNDPNVTASDSLAQGKVKFRRQNVSKTFVKSFLKTLQYAHLIENINRTFLV